MRLERVVFALNGRRYKVGAGDVHPGTTLLEFIRSSAPRRHSPAPSSAAGVMVRVRCYRSCVPLLSVIFGSTCVRCGPSVHH
ncbi:hypothetical protein CFC21_105388 [Triticum aestivum]|uniref:Uncharacterized protein n=3 Tax=Triticum TaxID=4564 RepID=A0A9R1ACE6_TRITD|nr:hypothetical protein CFC21_105388 [Triticum aestivum]VAI92970.1 unnamed protein product [Triticum turgidum subsp. durum]